MRFDKQNISTAKIDFRITPQEKEEITSFCKEKGFTRAEFIREAIFEKMARIKAAAAE